MREEGDGTFNEKITMASSRFRINLPSMYSAAKVHPDHCGLIVILSVVFSILSQVICYKLWGGWVACYFGILNIEWIKRSIAGGNESLLMFLVLLGILMYRNKRDFISLLLFSFFPFVGGKYDC